MQKPNIEALITRINLANVKWWHDINTGEPILRNRGELLMLVITELAEATEGIRKNLMDDKLPHRLMEEVEMADAYIRLCDYSAGFKVGTPPPISRMFILSGFLTCGNKAQNILILCKAIISIYDNEAKQSVGIGIVFMMIEEYCRYYGLDLWGAIEEKLEFNRTRADHTAEARRGEHGKKF